MWSGRPGLHPLDARSTPDVTARSQSRSPVGGGQHCPVSRCAVTLEVVTAPCIERGLPAAPDVGNVSPRTGASPT